MKKIILSVMLMLGVCFTWNAPAHATVTSTSNKIIYAGDGINSTFSFSFNVFNSPSENDLVLTKVVAATGVSTTLALTTDYTVSLTHRIPSPGSITLTAGVLPVGTSLVIQRTLPITQQVNVADNSPTPASTTNAVYDRAIMISQQLQTQLTQGVIQNPLSSTILTLPIPVASQCIGWAGDLSLTNYSCSGSSGGGGSGGSSFSPPIPDSQLQSIVTSSKVAGSAIYNLNLTPSGAGLLPTANINVGTSANQLVQLTAATKYPAVDGSLITSIQGSNLINLTGVSSLAGIIPVANLASGTCNSSSFIRGDQTCTAVTAGTNTQYFTSSGTFTAPAGITKVYVTMIAGGGGGGGANATSANSGGGGGSGAYVINKVFTVVPASGYTVTVGAGGAGGNGLNNGSIGGSSTFDTFSVLGGSGGINGSSTTANGGAGGVGLTLFSVSTASSTSSVSGFSGSPGARANTASSFGGTGGASPWGVTSGSSGSDATGNPGTANTGVGGGGCFDTGGSNRVGGAGGSGFVIVAY